MCALSPFVQLYVLSFFIQFGEPLSQKSCRSGYTRASRFRGNLRSRTQSCRRGGTETRNCYKSKILATNRTTLNGTLPKPLRHTMPRNLIRSLLKQFGRLAILVRECWFRNRARRKMAPAHPFNSQTPCAGSSFPFSCSIR